jgi:hypothetical protein
VDAAAEAAADVSAGVAAAAAAAAATAAVAARDVVDSAIAANVDGVRTNLERQQEAAEHQKLQQVKKRQHCPFSGMFVSSHAIIASHTIIARTSHRQRIHIASHAIVAHALICR